MELPPLPMSPDVEHLRSPSILSPTSPNPNSIMSGAHDHQQQQQPTKPPPRPYLRRSRSSSSSLNSPSVSSSSLNSAVVGGNGLEGSIKGSPATIHEGVETPVPGTPLSPSSSSNQVQSPSTASLSSYFTRQRSLPAGAASSVQ